MDQDRSGGAPHSSRRDFARRLALGTVGAVAAPTLACRGGSDVGSLRPDASVPALGGPLDPRLARIVARHGARLTPADRAVLARQLKSLDEASAAVRKFPLEVADEPALALRPRPVARRAR